MSKGLEALASAVGEAATDETAKAKPGIVKPLTMEEKLKALKSVELHLNKQFDTTASIVRLGSRANLPVPSDPTNIYTVDFDVIATGGVPRGRIIEVYGPESSGKTSLALHIVAQEQKRGDLAAFVDAEHALDPQYAKKLGVDIDNLLVSQPDSGEQALETVLALVESRAVSIIVVDSVAALVPQAELDGDMGDAHMGLQARLIGQAMRKLRAVASRNNVKVIFINQIREKLGGYGNPETTTGGRALKFYASVRLDVRKVSKTNGGEIMSGGVQVGHKMKIKAVKNKVGTPFRETIVDLIYGVGVDTVADFIEYAVNCGAIQSKGAWYVLPDKNGSQFQGMAKLKEGLKDSDTLMDIVKAEVKKAQAAQREAEAS